MEETETIIEKLNRLSPVDQMEVEDFIEFLLTKAESGDGEERLYRKLSRQLAEEGMGEYLKNLEAYEDMLAAGKIKW